MIELYLITSLAVFYFQEKSSLALSARFPDKPQIHPNLAPLAGLVGGTPLIPLHGHRLGLPADVVMYAKAEWMNPTGSIKDRPAVAILRDALSSGPVGGRSLLDSSSGNMGIAYATFAPRRGLEPLHLVVPANISATRRSTLQALGVKLTLSDPLEGSDGARQVAAELAQSQADRYLYLDQYRNPANPRSHYHGTGPEIAEQTDGQVTHIVAGLGTGGTLTGIGRYMREELPQVELVAVQPDSPLHGLEGLKHYASSPVPEIFDPSLPDRTLSVTTEQAYAMVVKLAREEGLLLGVSSGAAIHAAAVDARRLGTGTYVVICPDTGTRYLHEPFWEARS